MSHIGVISPPVSGHLNPLAALGSELQRRGHRVTLISFPDAQPDASAAGLEFRAIGEAELPRGKLAERSAALGRLTGLRAVRFTAEMFKQETNVQLRDLPPVLEELNVDGLVVDQTSPAGGAVADLLNLPFVTVCAALMLTEDAAVPPPMVHWHYRTPWWARLRNRFGFFVLRLVSKPIRDRINTFRLHHGLAGHKRPADFSSRLAIISQVPVEFDFPRRAIPDWFHYCGPLLDADSRAPVDFPFERLTDRPLVYASLGTLQNRQLWLFSSIAQACAGLEVQLVLSLGGADAAMSADDLPGSPLVVRFAPQLQLLQRAKLAITHAGLNTVLESLAFAVPLVAIPITNDQPGVAARLAWTGAGEVVRLSRLTVGRLHTAIERVLTEDSYRQRAAALQRAIAKCGGVHTAADIAEQAIRTGKPVPSGALPARQ
jgi:MGT family glycosyltransferase